MFDTFQNPSGTGSAFSLQQQLEDISANLEEAQSKIQLYEQERSNAQAENTLQASLLEDAQTTIALQEQEIQNWMGQASLYYNRYTQCQDALGQIQCSLQLMYFQDDIE